MSDYLGNLITRTLSADAFVRPRLPSLFETSPVDHSASLELEQAGVSSTPPTPLPAPQSHSTKSEAEQEVISESPPATARLDAARKIQLAILSPTESVLTQSAPATPVTQSFEPEMTSVVKSPEKENQYANKIREPSPDDLVQSPPDPLVKSHPVPIRAEAIAADSRKRSSPAEQVDGEAPNLRDNKEAISIAPRSTENSEPEFSSLPKPAVRIEKARTVKAIVPAIRNVPHAPSTPAQVAPAINVTIGRVEIRATTPRSSPQRAQPKSSKVLSLENYLRQRAKGGQR
ncbi:MAG TPA: hypothetical protein VGI60_17230 [Chthoniobacterales bacterium]|jgi:hypothetical protein